MFLGLFFGLTKKKMQDVFGILLMFAGAASGLLFQDPVVCTFNQSNQCNVALGQRLHLQMPLEDQLDLNIIDKTSIPRLILKYRKTQINSTKPKLPNWQFVNESKTMILTSAESSDSGTYNLLTNDVNGTLKGNYTLQLNTEAEVSSVKLWYSCLFPGVMKVYCSADGDNLRFNWTSGLNTLPQLENGTSTLTLNKSGNHQGKVTCRVENHVSYNYNTTELHPCPEPTTTASTTLSSGGSPTLSLGTHSTVSQTNSSNQNVTTSITDPTSPNNSSEVLKYTLIIMGSVCVLLIMISIFAFCIYKKRQGQKNKEAPSQDGGELVYAQVTHLPTNKTETRPAQAQDDNVEYAMVVARTTKKKQKKKEDEVQYGELVFNTAVKNKPQVQDDCVYSQVQHGR